MHSFVSGHMLILMLVVEARRASPPVSVWVGSRTFVHAHARGRHAGARWEWYRGEVGVSDVSRRGEHVCMLGARRGSSASQRGGMYEGGVGSPREEIAQARRA
ncbi:hypothetical protein BJY52DRAFT_1314437 [Lactarius psammicola]|nr:hypothetical protein BJY52DRAFT_1314437 [Lactarius psammicola]